jgi:hypothetical protein
MKAKSPGHTATALTIAGRRQHIGIYPEYGCFLFYVVGPPKSLPSPAQSLGATSSKIT